MPAWLEPVEGGVSLCVLVQPRASRTRVVGEHGGLLKVQVAAPPVEGEANAALLEFLSRQLGVPRRQVELVAGEGSRRKRVVVRGVGAAEAEAAMSPGT